MQELWRWHWVTDKLWVRRGNMTKCRHIKCCILLLWSASALLDELGNSCITCVLRTTETRYNIGQHDELSRSYGVLLGSLIFFKKVLTKTFTLSYIVLHVAVVRKQQHEEQHEQELKIIILMRTFMLIFELSLYCVNQNTLCILLKLLSAHNNQPLLL